MKRYLFVQILLSVLVVVSSCDTSPAKEANNDTIKPTAEPRVTIDSAKNDSIAVAQVEALPEYKNLLKWFDKNNKDTAKHVAIIIDQEPIKKFNYYRLSLGIDGPIRFEDKEYFYVDAKTLSVSYQDKETDNMVSLSQWRKSGKDEWLH